MSTSRSISSYTSRENSSDRHRSRRHRSHRKHSRRDHRSHRREHSRHREKSVVVETRISEGVEGETPSCTIMIRQLPLFVTEKHIMEEMVALNIPSLDIRLVRRKDTGTSRGFAFIDFKTVDESQDWMYKNNGTWHFMDRYQLPMAYCTPKPLLSFFPDEHIAQDWDCTKCNTHNFKKRHFCFRCNISKEQVLAEQGHNQIGNNPCNTLILRGLDALTDENSLIENISKWTTTPLKNLYVMRDQETQISKGFAFIELSSVSESRKVLDELCLGEKPLEIDGKEILIDFSRNTFATIIASLHHWEEKRAPTSVYQADTSNVGAAVAQAAMNKGKCQPEISQSQESSYVYDESSGYYYDSSTGMYYDPNSKYFYNSMTGQYLYWNGSCYVAHTEQVPDKKAEPKKLSAEAKAAKKIQRDMEKWAISQNSSNVQNGPTNGGKSNTSEGTNQFVLPVESQESTSSENLVNWTRLVCLLCKRQFTTREVLEKHVNMSQLHAKNLQVLNKPKEGVDESVSSGFVDVSIDVPQRKYRDRAQERRDKLSEQPTDAF